MCRMFRTPFPENRPKRDETVGEAARLPREADRQKPLFHAASAMLIPPLNFSGQCSCPDPVKQQEKFTVEKFRKAAA